MNTRPDADSSSLADAQRTYSRWNVWFWLFVACIPLGFILPLVVAVFAFKIWGDTISAPIGLSALLWPIAGVGGALLVRGARKRARRSLGIARLADARDWQFTTNPAPQKYEFFKTVSFMKDPHTCTGKNLVESHAGRFPWMALDYEYWYLYGTINEVGSHTIVAFLSGFEQLPEFAIIPIGVVGRIENLFLGKGGAIESPLDNQFNRLFGVYGDDAKAVQRCLSRKLIDMFLADRLLTAVVEGDRLFVFRRLTYVAADEYSEFLARTRAIAELLTN